MILFENNELVEEARTRFADPELFDAASPLVLMISGGSDSVALLRLACLIHEDERPLLVLHTNHQLRGEQADHDERFVEQLCAELTLDNKIERIDVRGLAAKTGEGTEQAGRRLRYECAAAALDELCAQHGVNREQGRIVTAHTANDRAETLLQRLIVGGGGSSLASIPWKNGRVVRPLLGCTQQELRAWLIESDARINGELWCEDATNADTAFSRAFVRHEILPLLAERNPRIVESLNRTADVLSDESLLLDSLALDLLPLRSESFAAPRPLLRRAIYRACNDAILEFAPDARITFEHIELIASKGAEAGFACQIPGGIEVRNLKGQLIFKKAKPPKHTPRRSDQHK